MFEYVPGDSLLHRLDVRTKTTGFLTLTLLCFLFERPLYNFILVLICVGLALYSGLSLRRLWAKLKPLTPIFVLIVLMSGISYSPDWFDSAEAQVTLFSMFGFIHLTVGGLLFGLSLLLRIMVMVVATSVLIFTTPLDDFLQFMQKLKMPYQLAFVLTTAIRFVPTMERKTNAIIEAQKARGANIGNGRFFQRIRTYIPVMIPMLIVSVRMSENLAIGMLNRGYGANTKVTPLREIKMKRVDYFLIGLFLAIIFLSIFLSCQGFGKL